jgi:hypothetical protein
LREQFVVLFLFLVVVSECVFPFFFIDSRPPAGDLDVFSPSVCIGSEDGVFLILFHFVNGSVSFGRAVVPQIFWFP